MVQEIYGLQNELGVCFEVFLLLDEPFGTEILDKFFGLLIQILIHHLFLHLLLLCIKIILYGWLLLCIQTSLLCLNIFVLLLDLLIVIDFKLEALLYVIFIVVKCESWVVKVDEGFLITENFFGELEVALFLNVM